MVFSIITEKIVLLTISFLTLKTIFMKKLITLCSLIAAVAGDSIAQPIITSSITSSPIGTIDTAYAASATVAPGSGGAGITWNMSTLATIFAAKLTVANPATTPYASTFPSATFAVKVEGTTTTYNYDRQSSMGVENVAITYGGVGVGTDYSPNLRMSVPFPFHYTDVARDTFQTTTSGQDTVRLTYDGYGTLITPFHTYTNVIRIKEESSATNYHYSWYTVSPFVLIMNYSSTGNNYVIVNATPNSTGISSTAEVSHVTVYPNPMWHKAILKTDAANGYRNASVTIADITGRVVKTIPVTSAETVIEKDGFAPGLYFYTVQNDGVKIANGTLAVN
jgi:hypothetical protein